MPNGEASRVTREGVSVPRPSTVLTGVCGRGPAWRADGRALSAFWLHCEGGVPRGLWPGAGVDAAGPSWLESFRRDHAWAARRKGPPRAEETTEWCRWSLCAEKPLLPGGPSPPVLPAPLREQGACVRRENHEGAAKEVRQCRVGPAVPLRTRRLSRQALPTSGPDFSRSRSLEVARFSFRGSACIVRRMSCRVVLLCSGQNSVGWRSVCE